MATYTCPNGHPIEVDGQTAPECRKCHLIATTFDAATGRVYQWKPRAEFDQMTDRLADMSDSAIDHEYFGDW